MANMHRGEVSETIGGETYVFRIATNEWCELEDEHGKTTDELIAEFFQLVSVGKLKMTYLRSFFRAALVGTRAGISHRDAGEIMSDMGLVEAGALLGKVISASIPDPEPADTENPPKAAAGSTGRRSSETGAVPGKDQNSSGG